MVVHGGTQSRSTSEGSVAMLELKRGAAAFPVDKHLYCDPFLVLRRKQFVANRLRAPSSLI